MYEPRIDPETGRPYDEEGVCFGPAIPVAAGERIELNHGDYVGPGTFARWEGTYRCALRAGDTASGSLALEVRIADMPMRTCQARDGGLVIAAAAVSLQLKDADGAALHDGPCDSLADVVAWPGHTLLHADCADVAVGVRSDWIRVDRIRSGTKEITFYDVQCARAGGD